MKVILSFLVILLCFSLFGYGADTSSPSVEILIKKIKQSKNGERKEALSLLKERLKGLKKTQRRHIMTKLQSVLSNTPNKQHTSASEILGAFGSAYGNRGGSGGGSGQGGGNSGGGHGGGGHGGGGNGGGGHGGR